MTDSESESPKDSGKRLTRSGLKETSDADASPPKGKKGGKKGKGKKEDVKEDESGKGKKKGKGKKVEDSESEDDVPLQDIKKKASPNEQLPKKKGKGKEEDDGKSDHVQKASALQTPVRKLTQDKNSDDSPRSIFKMFESGLIQEDQQVTTETDQPAVSSLVTEVLELPITSGKKSEEDEGLPLSDPGTTGQSDQISVIVSKDSDQVIVECEAKVEEVNYEDFITAIGEPKVIAKKETVEGETKPAKPVKKKTKKSEEIKVDQSMLDLFKPDVDVSSKKKGGVGGKKGAPSAPDPAKLGEKPGDTKQKLTEFEKVSCHKSSDPGKSVKVTGGEKTRKDSEKETSPHGRIRRDSEKDKIKKDVKKSETHDKSEKDKQDRSESDVKHDKKGVKDVKVKVGKERKKVKSDQESDVVEKASTKNENSITMTTEDTEKTEQKQLKTDTKEEKVNKESESVEVKDSELESESRSIGIEKKEVIGSEMSESEVKVENKEDTKSESAIIPEDKSDVHDKKETSKEKVKEKLEKEETVSQSSKKAEENDGKEHEEVKVTPGSRGQRKAKLKFLKEKLPEMTEKEKRPKKKKLVKDKKPAVEVEGKEMDSGQFNFHA